MLYEVITLAASVGAESTTGDGAEQGATRKLRHRAIVSGGGLRAICDWDDPAIRVVAGRDGDRADQRVLGDADDGDVDARRGERNNFV